MQLTNLQILGICTIIYFLFLGLIILFFMGSKKREKQQDAMFNTKDLDTYIDNISKE